MRKNSPKTFRPTEKSSEIIEEIQEVFGWNFQQIINEIIENEGQDFLKKKAEEMHKRTEGYLGKFPAAVAA